MNNTPIDTKTMPVWASPPKCHTIDTAENIKKAYLDHWEKGAITSIEYLIFAVSRDFESIIFAYGSNLLECRREIVARNNEIDRLNTLVEKYHTACKAICQHLDCSINDGCNCEDCEAKYQESILAVKGLIEARDKH